MKVCCVSLLTLIFLVSVVEAAQPNILLVMADDLGWSDIGRFGGEIRTTHIDSLARDGLRFTQFYNNAVCGPTRASLWTGLYCQQAGRRGIMSSARASGKPFVLDRVASGNFSIWRRTAPRRSILPNASPIEFKNWLGSLKPGRNM